MSIPSWLLTPGPVLLRKHVQQSKYDPSTVEVELISANPNYAHIRKPNGQEGTVSIRDLAPAPHNSNFSDSPQVESVPEQLPMTTESSTSPSQTDSEERPPIRRSQRTRKPPDRFCP